MIINIAWLSFLQFLYAHVNGEGFGVPMVGMARIKSKHEKSDHPVSEPLLNNYNTYYYGIVTLGTSKDGGKKQQFKLFFDTGSSDLIVVNSVHKKKCNNPKTEDKCKNVRPQLFDTSKSATYKTSDGTFSIRFRDGVQFAGHIAHDFLEIGQGASSIRAFAQIGMASLVVNEATDSDGMFGLSFGPDSLLKPSILTPLESIFAQHDIPSQLGYYVIKDENIKVKGEYGGEIYFGGYNPDYVITEFSDPIPVIRKDGITTSWIFALNSIRVGDNVLTLEGQDVDGDGVLGTEAMPDTGTSYTNINENIYRIIMSFMFPVQGSQPPKESSFLCGDLPDVLPEVTFVVNEHLSLTLGPENYLETEFDGLYCRMILRGKNNYDIILGNNFLQKYYTVFDYGKKAIMFATAKQGPTSDNRKQPAIYGRERLSQYPTSEIERLRNTYPYNSPQ